jgi:hypothetical protein
MKYITLVFTTLTFLSFQFVHCQEDPHLAPYFHIPCEECAHDAFPLLRTEARVDITGVIADVRIRQVYSNEGKVPIEAVYVFPGSTRAAVYDMQMRIGERQISAVIQEKNAARRTYQQAREQGRFPAGTGTPQCFSDERSEYHAGRRGRSGNRLHGMADGGRRHL